MFLLTRASLDALLLQPKFAHGWTGFQKRDNQANFFIGVAQLTDDQDVFIPGLTVEIELRTGVEVDRCLALFTLRKRVVGARPRLYQLEVCPRDKRSHNGDPVIYGPHEHFLDDEVCAVEDMSVNCGSWEASLNWFVARVNVRNFLVESPW